MRFALGLIKEMPYARFIGSKVELEVLIGTKKVLFHRDLDSQALNVDFDDCQFSFKCLSVELNNFFREIFDFYYLYPGQQESAFEVIDFYFLSADVSVNRRKQWLALRTVLGVNVALIQSVGSDLAELKRDISFDASYKKMVLEFSEVLGNKIDSKFKSEFLLSVESAKSEFFDQFLARERIYSNASEKLKKISGESEFYEAEELQFVSRAVLAMASYCGINSRYVSDIKELLLDKTNALSYGEDVLLRFFVVCAVAFDPEDRKWNSPGVIVNDCYFARSSDPGKLDAVSTLVRKAAGVDTGLQYTEFAYSDSHIRYGNIINIDARALTLGVI